MLKILLIGSKGQLGFDLLETGKKMGHQIIGLDLPEIDVTDEKLINAAFFKYAPDTVISCAAFHEVDICETKSKSAYLVNAIGVFNLACACQNAGARFITFSTDYVFDGKAESKKPFVETDTANPASVYAASKRAGEVLAGLYSKDSVVIRSNGLYGITPPAKKAYNFPQIMLKLASEGKQIKVVDDQYCTPTWTKPLAKTVFDVLDSDISGIVHATCQGACNWFEFASEIFKLSGVEADLVPVSTSEYGQAAKRPRYSVLENQKLKKYNLDTLPHWRDALHDYLKLKGEIK